MKEKNEHEMESQKRVENSEGKAQELENILKGLKEENGELKEQMRWNEKEKENREQNYIRETDRLYDRVKELE